MIGGIFPLFSFHSLGFQSGLTSGNIRLLAIRSNVDKQDVCDVMIQAIFGNNAAVFVGPSLYGSAIIPAAATASTEQQLARIGNAGKTSNKPQTDSFC